MGVGVWFVSKQFQGFQINDRQSASPEYVYIYIYPPRHQLISKYMAVSGENEAQPRDDW